MPRISTFSARARLQRKTCAQDRVIHEMLPDGGRIMQNVNTQAAQSLGRADAAAHQNAGAMDGAGTKHHLTRGNILKSASAEAHAHTRSAAPFED
jgi:hypothetical protein